jgi:ATP-dependent protease ClpP protease subunit
MKSNLEDLLTVKILDDKAILYIYGDIVSDWHGSWSDLDTYPETILRFLDKANGLPLELHINSGGGNVFAGIAIYNMLRMYKAKKVVFIEGIAASIASVIALAGDEIYIMQGAIFMIHSPYMLLFGGYNDKELLKLSKDMEQIKLSIISIYKNKTTLSEKELLQCVDEEKYFTAEEASKYFGFTLEYVLEIAAKFEIYPSNYLNKIIKEGENQMPTKEEKATEQFNVKVDDIVKQSLEAERKRLQEIDEIAPFINDTKLVSNAKYGENKMTAQELSYAKIVAEKANNSVIFEKMKKADNAQIITSPNGGLCEKSIPEAKEVAAKMAAAYNKSKGEKQ